MSTILVKLFLITFSLLSVLGAPATLDKRGGCRAGYGYNLYPTNACSICPIGTANSAGVPLPCHGCGGNTYSNRPGFSGCATCNRYTWIQFVGTSQQGIDCRYLPQVPVPQPQPIVPTRKHS